MFCHSSYPGNVEGHGMEESGKKRNVILSHRYYILKLTLKYVNTF